jgi:hypothetical protein
VGELVADEEESHRSEESQEDERRAPLVERLVQLAGPTWELGKGCTARDEQRARDEEQARPGSEAYEDGRVS